MNVDICKLCCYCLKDINRCLASAKDCKDVDEKECVKKIELKQARSRMREFSAFND